MSDKKEDQVAQNGLYGFSKTVKECLRSYLFLISVDDKDDVNEKTCFVRNIKWTKDEITIETLIDEGAIHLHDLINMRKLKVCFLDRTGNRVLDDTFTIKGLKHKYPLEVNHESLPGFVVYRLVFEY